MKFKLLMICCSLCACKSTDFNDDVLKDELSDLISSEWIDVPGIAVDIVSNKTKISTYSGFSDKERKIKLIENQPFRVASITKTFVAAAILRLHEEGRLSIYDPISDYLSEEHLNILKQGNYQAQDILILHCLNHTSGLFDYAFGKTENGISPYVSHVVNAPYKIWTRTEQLKMAVEWGKPYGKPGSIFQYSDTGYILLGEIIENSTQLNIGTAIRNLLGFKNIGLNNTWYEYFEPATTPTNLVNRYFNGKDFTHYHASIDLYGGGGIISTTADLAVFYFHLFQGNLFKKAATKALLFSKPDPHLNPQPATDYRLGFEVMNICGQVAYIHQGLWNTQVIYLPALETAVAVSFTEKGTDYVLKHIVSQLSKRH